MVKADSLNDVNGYEVFKLPNFLIEVEAKAV